MEQLKDYPFTLRRHRLPNDLGMNYVDEGRGEVVVLLHGNPTWSYYWRHLITALKDQYRVIAPDHIGMGLSSKPEHYDYTLKNHIENLDSLLESLEIKKATLIMHDWGGAIGMGWAVQNPKKVEKLVITNTAAFTDLHIPWRINILRNPLGEKFIRKFNGFAGPATYMAVKKPLSKESVHGYLFPYQTYQDRIATAKFVRDIPMNEQHKSWNTLTQIERRLTDLNVPTLILWGDKDFCFTTHFRDRWKEIYPHAHLINYPNSGHYLMEDSRDEVIKEIKNHLGNQAYEHSLAP